MVELVNAMLCIPGVHTLSSCGGHDDPTGGQEPRGQFNVNLDVTRNAKGWQALAIIQTAIQMLDAYCEGDIAMTVWADPDDASPEGVHLDLTGKHDADPDELAVAICMVTEGRQGGTNPGIG